MVKFQLWSRDEYGQGSIIASSENLDELIEKGRYEVNDLNANNALTIEDKKRNWEAFFVEVESEEKKVVYGGKNNHNIDILYDIKEDSIDTLKFGDIKTSLKMYLGKLNDDEWFATDNRGKEITSLGHLDLQGKTVYFVRKI